MSLNKINITVARATGYVGLDLIKILSSHPRVSIKYLCAQKKIGKNIQFFDKRIKKKLPKISNLKNVEWNKIDLLFCSLPTGQSQILAKKLIKKYNLKIIDLSADFRLSNKKDFYKFYKLKHSAPELLKFSKYSLTEFAKKDLKKFKIIACPGCYPTSIQLPILPLLKKKLLNTKGMIIDSKSGYSGAGKNLKKKFTHKNIFSAIKAYGILNHRHTAEIDQEFKKVTKSKIHYNFTPHLIPTFRGMLSTIYVEPMGSVTIKKIHKELKNFHKKNNFVKILPINKSLGTENVINTNLCEISVCKLKGSKKIMILSSIDNLIKGASGQAVQNMNIMYNLNEKIGLK